MGTPTYVRTDLRPDTAPWCAADTPEMHNASVDEDAAREGVCAQVHLPTGWMCVLPHGHTGTCNFIPAETAYASLPSHRSGGPK